MIDPFRLALAHREGTPPPTAEVLGTLATPAGGTVTVAGGRGRVLLCWWRRAPTPDTRRAFHRQHGFAPPPDSPRAAPRAWRGSA